MNKNSNINNAKYIVAAFSFNNKRINNINQLIASTYFCNELYLNYSSISERLKSFHCRKLIFVYISSEKIQTKAVYLTRSEYLAFIRYDVSLDNFFNDMMFTYYISKNDPQLKNMIFLFENLS